MLVDAFGALLTADHKDQLAPIMKMGWGFIVDPVSDRFSRTNGRVRDYRVIRMGDVGVNVAGDDLDLGRNAQTLSIFFRARRGREGSRRQGDVTLRVSFGKD
jgi:hypothetical protein